MLKNIKRCAALLLILPLIFTGCKSENENKEGSYDTGNAAEASDMTTVESVLEDGMTPVFASDLNEGEYDIEMKSSSSMFKADHVKLIVRDDKLIAKLYMTSKSYIYMYPGTAKDAAKDSEENFIKPEAEDNDMTSFSLDIEALDSEYICSAFSKNKELWYDRTLLFKAASLPEEAFKNGRKGEENAISVKDFIEENNLSDGEYLFDVTLSGGSGKASIESPCTVTIEGEKAIARIVWSSKNYDYMIADDEEYLPVEDEENPDVSVFLIPVAFFNKDLSVKADTTAMSKPYLIDYTLNFDGDSVKKNNEYGKLFFVEKISENKARVKTGDDPEIIIDIPIDNVYLASSQTMDLFKALDKTESIKMTSTKESEWADSFIKNKVKKNEIEYIGKYSSPDFEKLIDNDCALAIENTMILHTPKIKEQIENLGIPVIIDYSSREESPLARLEWIRFYGVLTGNEEDADSFFYKEKERYERIKAEEKKDISVCYFYYNSSGLFCVRKPGDYVSTLIEDAGGKYAFHDMEIPDEEKNALSTINIGTELFYSYAKDCDIIIYDTAIDKGIKSLSDIESKSSILSDLKAFKNKNVYYSTADMFQSTAETADILSELNDVINGRSTDENRFIRKAK